MAWIDQNLKKFMMMIDQRPNHPPLPAFFPIASAGRIIFRTYDTVCCVATRDDASQNPPVKAGELLWMADWSFQGLYAMVSDGSRRSQMDQNWMPPYMQQGPFGIFFENGLIGAMSHDGSLVYFVDDIAVPPHAQQQQMFNNNGQPMAFGSSFNDMVHHSKLVAVNLETGKLVWRAGGRIANKKAPVPGEVEKETSESLLSDAFFLGAPLPLAGKIYLVIEKDRDLHLVCLDPTKIDASTHHPELVWSQPLGNPHTPLPTDSLRRMQGISLAYSDNVLVVPTNAGAVLGIDLLSHSIIWARSYRMANKVVDPNAGVNLGGMGGRRFVNGMQQPNPDQFLNADRWRTWRRSSPAVK